MTSSNGNSFRVLLAICVGSSPGALMFSMICAWINGWANNRGAGDLGRHGAHYDVTLISYISHIRYAQSCALLLSCFVCLFVCFLFVFCFVVFLSFRFGITRFHPYSPMLSQWHLGNRIIGTGRTYGFPSASNTTNKTDEYITWIARKYWSNHEPNRTKNLTNIYGI